MKENFLVVICCLVVSGCATLKMVERSSEKPLSSWVKGTPPTGYFRGIAINASNEKEGWHTALDDVKKQICNAMGFEIREEYERKVIAYNDKVDKSVVADLKCTSVAFLEDIDSSVEDTYFEKWMQKTRYGKKYFCNYYILVYYPESKIDEMKRKTEEENQKRISSLERCLLFGEEQENNGEFMKALRTYIYAVFIANTLFKNSEIRASECVYKLIYLIASLRLKGIGNYVEEHASTHKVVVKATMNDVPAINVPIKLEITSGQGKVNPVVFTDKDGSASSRVSMTSIQQDNGIRAFVNFSDILSVNERLLPVNEIKEVNFVFSTLSKVANVQGGTLYVDKKRESLFKKIPVLMFDIREVNGLGAVFDRYDIEVKGMFERKNWLTGKVKSWIRSEVGNFNLNEKILIEAKGKKTVVSKWNAWLMDTFKSMSKEKHCRKIQLILTLYGKDDNGNICKVSMESTPMPANPH